MAQDPYGNQDALIASARNAYVITPDDDTDLTVIPKALYIGGDGDLVVDMVGDGEDIPFPGLTASSILPIRPVRVKEATTATSIVALY